jgi:16S rRNA G966 N2-methylase RsmD
VRSTWWLGITPGRTPRIYDSRVPNTLYYGDNLDILRKHVATESVDLIYLDPPFNSNRSYNVLFKAHSREAAPKPDSEAIPLF